MSSINMPELSLEDIRYHFDLSENSQRRRSPMIIHKKGDYINKVYMLPKHLDEKVAKLHLEKLGVELEELSSEQADYIGVKVEGPFKPEYYRY